jgi:hypothetical protein
VQEGETEPEEGPALLFYSDPSWEKKRAIYRERQKQRCREKGTQEIFGKMVATFQN